MTRCVGLGENFRCKRKANEIIKTCMINSNFLH